MTTQKKKGKDPQDKTQGVSVTRPKWLVEAMDDLIRKMAFEMKKDINHSQVVCMLEEMALENAEVKVILYAKLKARS